MLSTLPKVTQLGSRKAGIRSQGAQPGSPGPRILLSPLDLISGQRSQIAQSSLTANTREQVGSSQAWVAGPLNQALGLNS